MAKFPVLFNLHGIYTLLRGRIKVKMCYFTLPFLGDPSWYILSQAVAIETRNLSYGRVSSTGILNLFRNILGKLTTYITFESVVCSIKIFKKQFHCEKSLKSSK